MKIMVIAVHPDDETLGCGGTILKHIFNKDEVYWLILTDVLQEYGYHKEDINKEHEVVEKVNDAYGFKGMFNLGFPAGNIHLISFEKIIGKISEVINKIRPEIIYMPNRSDIHTDHQISVKAIWSCTKAFRYPFIKKILMYECVSETDAAPALPENVFIPNVFSDISNYIENKIEILKLYDSEIGEPPFPRSIDNIRALARYRGSSVSTQFAEAFMLVREIY